MKYYHIIIYVRLCFVLKIMKFGTPLMSKFFFKLGAITNNYILLVCLLTMLLCVHIRSLIFFIYSVQNWSSTGVS